MQKFHTRLTIWNQKVYVCNHCCRIPFKKGLLGAKQHGALKNLTFGCRIKMHMGFPRYVTCPKEISSGFDTLVKEISQRLRRDGLLRDTVDNFLRQEELAEYLHNRLLK